MADLNVLFQSLFDEETFETLAVMLYFIVIFRRSRDQTKQTLAAMFSFQCNFLLVVEADNLV